MLLPGQGYTLAHPLMHYSRLAAVEGGAQVVAIDYGSTKNVGFTEIAERCSPEVLAACGQASGVILIGKSLGTYVMTRLLANESLSHRVIAAAWLTPLLGDDEVFAAMAAFDQPACVAIGSRDPHFLPDRLAALPAATDVIRLSDADHSLEIAGDVATSLAALAQVVTTVRRLVAGVAGTEAP